MMIHWVTEHNLLRLNVRNQEFYKITTDSIIVIEIFLFVKIKFGISDIWINIISHLYLL